MKQSRKNPMPLFDRDLSWLSFNARVLAEAERATVPLMERIRFLAIYSSNLDEFYRVRVPSLIALKGISTGAESKDIARTLTAIGEIVLRQQKHFGGIIENHIIPELRSERFNLLYNELIPESIHSALRDYFIHVVSSYIQIVDLSEAASFFPENHKLYITVTTQVPRKGKRTHIVTVPSDSIPRFYSLVHDGTQFIVFLEDIIKLNLQVLFPGQKIISSHNFKITRDSDLNLQDEFTGNLARKIEKKIGDRDSGFATRFLYEPGIRKPTLQLLRSKMGLHEASFIPGGRYHNLKDLASLPLKDIRFQYEPWPPVKYTVPADITLFEAIDQGDILLHPPYHSYDTVLRFFNEASIDPTVKIIYVTLYRVANDSRIANALISAARNGKKVVVFVELKARFDEANNIKWSKKMKAAGVRIIESIPGLKVHAKLALVKRKFKKSVKLVGLIATGNFNEGTARFYTDHILMTSREQLLIEMEALFSFLKKGKKPTRPDMLTFDKLLVGQFNLQEKFINLIENEISNASKGLPSGITIKFNNLEDQVLIGKLYEASKAGVPVSLIVRGICCLVPGVAGWSENITVKRIIDRYLEHGRIFIFANNDSPAVFLGSADWMNRNIYRRIEVCFPLETPELIDEILRIVQLQLHDNCQAVLVDEHCNNIAIPVVEDNVVRSQLKIAGLVAHGVADN